MTQLERIAFIVNNLNNHTPLHKPTLVERFHVSQRTIERDIEAVNQHFFPVETTTTGRIFKP